MSPILTLNEYCLLHLYTFLSLPDQYRLSSLCERFANVFGTVFRRQHKSIAIIGSGIFGRMYESERQNGTVVRLHSDMTPFEWKQLIQQYGHMVETLECVYAEEQMNDCAGESLHCPNLKVLRLFGVPIEGPFVRLVANLKTLHAVELSNTCLEVAFAESLAKMKSLEVLRLSGVDGFAGDYFYSFRNLKELELREMPVDNLLFKSTLTKLAIVKCGKLNATKAIAHFGENLRELVISTSSCDFAGIRYLPKLEKLHLYIGRQIDDAVFIDLVARLKGTLRVLRIDFTGRHWDVLRKMKLLDQLLTVVQKQYILELNSLEELILNDFVVLDQEFLQKMLELRHLKHFRSLSLCRIDAQLIYEFIRKAPALQTFKVNDIDYCMRIV